MSRLTKGLAAAAFAALCWSGAQAAPEPQSQGGIEALLSSVAPPAAERIRLTDVDITLARQALAAARAGDRTRFSALATQISDPDARRLATWAMVDVAGETMGFYELDQARHDLAGWPRAARRQALAEKALENAGLGPQAIIAWFDGDEPATAEGAMALAASQAAQGDEAGAANLIRTFWRERMFESDTQRAMLSRFGSWLTQDDHIKRLDTLLLGPQGPAAQSIMGLVPAEYQQLAQVRIALRGGRSDALARADALPASVASDPGLAFERSRYLRIKDRASEGFGLLANWPQAPAHDDGAARLYSEARQYYIAALRARNWPAAYAAMADHGFAGGERRAESDFFAGWVALTKLGDPITAARHFEGVRLAGRTPLTQGRAMYWLGRAYEAQGNTPAAQAFWREGSQYVGAFYGQLSAEKAGFTTLTLPLEPVLTDTDRARFEGRDTVRALRILAQIGDPSFKAFLGQVDDTLTRPEDFAQLIDLAREQNENFAAMMVGRAAAGKGVILPERMYPVMITPQVANAPDPAFILAITRQESSFDPRARSPADARGMMMLLPSTARIVARQMGMGWDAGKLYDASYNMQLGSYHLGQLINNVSGSYLLTAAGYNAGPGRPARWIGDCGDPRGLGDPLDFIECTPFTETRDYMMRVMENMQVYRARLAGGSGPLTLASDLKRGTPRSIAPTPEDAAPAPARPDEDVAASSPVPDPGPANAAGVAP